MACVVCRWQTVSGMEAPHLKEDASCAHPALRPHVTEGEYTRLIAWAHELRAVHARLREALDLRPAPPPSSACSEPPFVFP